MTKRKPETLSAEFPVDPVVLLRAAAAIGIAETYSLPAEEVRVRLAKVEDSRLVNLMALEIEMGLEFKKRGDTKHYFDLYHQSLAEETKIEEQIGVKYPAESEAGWKDHQVAGAITGALLRLSDEIISRGSLAGPKTKKPKKA